MDNKDTKNDKQQDIQNHSMEITDLNFNYSNNLLENWSLPTMISTNISKPLVYTQTNTQNQTIANTNMSNIYYDYDYNLNVRQQYQIYIPRDTDISLAIDENKTTKTVTISYDEMVKYISEQQLIKENEVVRKMYDRFQIAIKLARSDKYDDTDFG